MVSTDPNLKDELLELAELRIIEDGGIPMRVTRSEYDRIMAHASNFDQNRRPRPG